MYVLREQNYSFLLSSPADKSKQQLAKRNVLS